MAIDAEDDRHWEMQERRLFGANHVVAGINFSKYDNIEVPVAIVPLKKRGSIHRNDSPCSLSIYLRKMT